MAHTMHIQCQGTTIIPGKLILAYLSTDVLRKTEIKAIAGLQRSIVNIPEDGKTDLKILQSTLIKDISISDADISIDFPYPVPGDPIVVNIDVHNSGDYAIDSFVVKLYASSQNSPNNLVGLKTVVGPFLAGDHKLLSFPFNFPTNGGDIIAIIDANNEISELFEDNNRATLHLTNTAPQSRIIASLTSGKLPLKVDLDASGSYDIEGDSLSYVWNFGDGAPSADGVKVSHTFNAAGVYSVALTAVDKYGAVGTAVVSITVYNSDNCLQSNILENQWKGEYYNNTTLNGQPRMIRNDGDSFINFNWYDPEPSTICGISQDQFSVRWTRSIVFTPGTYRFSMSVDDGGRLVIDGQTIIDKWIDQAETLYQANVTLTAGTHLVIFEYYEKTGAAVAKLSWQNLQSGQKEVPIAWYKFESNGNDSSGNQINGKLFGDPF
ncbi:MAG: PKD domain-containing protein [Acidobacteria bacterium]|nr:PKD domain-containing protein [Acidobacteriota bacterium]